MKIVIAREILQSGINAVRNLVATKSALPILSNILLRADKGKLTLIATDLDVGIECTVECTVEEAGSTTVPAGRLAEVIGTFPVGDITLDVQDGHLMELSSGVVRFHLLGQPADEFPPTPTFSEDAKITLPQRTLKEVLKRTSFAISSDMNRLALTGMLFDLRDNEGRFVATDGRRLSMAKLDLPGLAVTGKYIVPRKTVMELERLIGGDEPIDIFPAETQIGFRFGNIVLVSRTIDGHFPNYEQVIPKGHDNSALIRTEEFHQATRRAAVMTNDKNNLIRLHVEPKGLTVTTNTPDVGDVQDQIGVQYSGGELEIGFNPHFLLDILKVAESDEVEFRFKDALSPGLMKPVGNDDLLYVIMPIKL